jgi:predicted dehydrogenase
MRAAVLGSSFGCRVHVPALRAAGFEVVALLGRDADRTQRRAERAAIEHAVTSLDDALTLGLDAITIATPPYAHAEPAIAAARAGVAVLCEKPFALDAAEARAMLDAASSANVAHLVGHEFRWALDRATIGRAVREGRIGEPRLATIVAHVALAADPDTKLPEWWFDPARGGGWLGASGSHIVDQVRVWLADEVATVSATLPMVSARDRATNAEDSFVVRATTRRGTDVVLVQTAAAWSNGAGAVSAVAGTRGTVWSQGGEPWIADADGARPLEIPPDLVLPSGPGESDDPRHRFTHLELAPYIRLCEQLARGVRGEPFQAAVPVPTFVDGLAEMQVLDAIRESAANRGEITEVPT